MKNKTYLEKLKGIKEIFKEGIEELKLMDGHNDFREGYMRGVKFALEMIEQEFTKDGAYKWAEKRLKKINKKTPKVSLNGVDK